MSVLHLNIDNFKKEVVESDLPVIIDFYADWCGPCKMMAPVFEEVSLEYQGKLKFAKIDTQQNQEITQEFGISGIPTISFIKGDKEITRFSGYMTKEALKERIDKVLKDL